MDKNFCFHHLHLLLLARTLHECLQGALPEGGHGDVAAGTGHACCPFSTTASTQSPPEAATPPRMQWRWQYGMEEQKKGGWGEGKWQRVVK